MNTGNAAHGRQPKHLDHLEARRARRVLDAHADPERAGIEFLAFRRSSIALICAERRGLVGRGSRRRHRCAGSSYGLAECQSAGGGMARGGAVVDQRAAVLAFCRNAATSGAPISISSAVVTPSKAFSRLLAASWPCWCRSMKPGATIRPLASEHSLTGQRLRRDAHDPALRDADIADGIDARFGIHHAAALEHGVVGLRKRRCGEK